MWNISRLRGVGTDRLRARHGALEVIVPVMSVDPSGELALRNLNHRGRVTLDVTPYRDTLVVEASDYHDRFVLLLWMQELCTPHTQLDDDLLARCEIFG
jgi:hypothetical protein